MRWSVKWWWVWLTPLLVSLAVFHFFFPGITPEGRVVSEVTIRKDLKTILKATGASDAWSQYSSLPPEPTGKILNIGAITARSDPAERDLLESEAMVRSWLYLNHRRPEVPVGAINMMIKYGVWWLPIMSGYHCLDVTREEFGVLIEQSIRAHGQPDVAEMAAQLHPSLECRSTP